jgi:hypothetical protein
MVLCSVLIATGTPFDIYNLSTLTILEGTSSGDFNNVGSAWGFWGGATADGSLRLQPVIIRRRRWPGVTFSKD